MKAVAIPYVIALVLGVIVIGLLGYWFVSQGGKAISTGTKAECDSLCVLWRNSGFNAKPAGLDKCPGKLAESAFCAVKLGCNFFKNVDKPCEADEIDYGPTTEVNGRKVCCKS